MRRQQSKQLDLFVMAAMLIALLGVTTVVIDLLQGDGLDGAHLIPFVVALLVVAASRRRSRPETRTRQTTTEAP